MGVLKEWWKDVNRNANERARENGFSDKGEIDSFRHGYSSAKFAHQSETKMGTGATASRVAGALV